MKIVATSDLHGHLPPIPKCDLLIVGGDSLPLIAEEGRDAERWLDTNFRGWLETVPAKYIVGIAGNHDFLFEHEGRLENLGLPWIYLRDKGVQLQIEDENGVISTPRIYGIPWVPNLPGWAFNADGGQLNLKYQAIPETIDIVVSHGPPLGIVDNEIRHFGTRYAHDMIERVKPDLFICGHVHEGYGRAKVRSTDVYNVAHNDIQYFPVNPPMIITMGEIH